MKLNIPCIKCRVVQELDVPEDGYIEWESGTLIQNALPGLTPDQRELLISQLCPTCFKDVTDKLEKLNG